MFVESLVRLQQATFGVSGREYPLTKIVLSFCFHLATSLN